jgi:glutaredoxin-like YruB-family protein
MAVKVYSTPTCPYCTMAKKYLKENDVSFQDIDVSKSREEAMEMINKSGQRGVPVIDYNGQIIVGFDKGRLSKLISG